MLSLVLMALVPGWIWADSQLTYPETAKVDQTDDYHGTPVADPFRWLEDDVRESKSVADWVEAQNAVTYGYLKSLPSRDGIEQRLTDLWNYERFSAPYKAGGRYYFSKNDGLQNQSVLYCMDTLEETPRVLLDPNTWSDDGTVALSGTAFSDDGKYLAYGVQQSGSDWNTWKVMDIESGETLPDELNWVKFSSATWTKDGKGFFYSRYDEPQEGATFQSLNLNQKLCYHRVGTPQSEDTIVYQRPDHPEWGFAADVTEDGKYLVITVWKGTDDKYLIYYREIADEDTEPTELIGEFSHDFSFVGNDDSVFYFRTNQDAPRGRVIAIDTAQPERSAWREIIPETQDTLTSVGMLNDAFVADYLKDAHTAVSLYDLDGKKIRDVELPGVGTAAGFKGKRSDQETFYSFQSLTTPPRAYRYDLETGDSELIREAKVAFDPSDYVVKQVFYNSKDGTRIPMFIAHRKDIELNGENPTLLYGYGGFNISLTPSFSVARLAWMELGGVFAMPNLRGGGEYGEVWHEAGKLHNKQNVFDDFIAAAEWLIENKYTSPDKLAIQGRSNGGLLVGAYMTQRPDLFGACLPGVGVMDMLRFQRFTAGRFWVDEYGSADDPELFPTLYKYSPYHNLQPGTEYPATMVTTADTDDRVVPGHSFKFAAALQAAHAGAQPVMIRIETKAGHGAGKPTAKQIEEVADEWAFLVNTLDFEPRQP
ncbi:MAG: prolyl oligopeptidase family serine peptidase [Planctomycetota bacterium]